MGVKGALLMQTRRVVIAEFELTCEGAKCAKTALKSS